MTTAECNRLSFQHFVDLEDCDCVFCSAKDNQTGRTKLFLIFNEQRRIYIRNGRKDTWDELTDEYQYNRVRQTFNDAVIEKKVPYFRSETRFEI